MSDVSRELIDRYAKMLDEYWRSAKSIIYRPWREFDEQFNVARSIQRVETLKIAQKMDETVKDLLQFPLYMGNEKRLGDYIRLEEVLVENIARICRMDADMGINLKRDFFKHSRSLQATVRMYWKTTWNRIGFWFDDGVRAPS